MRSPCSSRGRRVRLDGFAGSRRAPPADCPPRSPVLKMTSRITRLAALALVFGACAMASATAAPAAATGSADAQFKRIYTTEWAWRSGHPGNADAGDSGRLDDVGAASQQRRLEYWQRVMTQLDAIDVAQLSPGNRVNFEVYHAQ